MLTATRIFRKKDITEIEDKIKLYKWVKLRVQVNLWLKLFHRQILSPFGLLTLLNVIFSSCGHNLFNPFYKLIHPKVILTETTKHLLNISHGPSSVLGTISFLTLTFRLSFSVSALSASLLKIQNLRTTKLNVHFNIIPKWFAAH